MQAKADEKAQEEQNCQKQVLIEIFPQKKFLGEHSIRGYEVPQE